MAWGGARGDQARTWRVDLGHLAQHDPLALEIRSRILAHPEGSAAEKAFSRMWGTIVLVRRVTPSSPASGLRELTLRFDYGRLSVHDGRVGRPDVSLWGTDAQILSLGEVAAARAPTAESSSLTAAPRRWWAMGRLISRASAAAGAPPLQIFGGFVHLRLLYRLAWVLSGSAQAEAARTRAP